MLFLCFSRSTCIAVHAVFCCHKKQLQWLKLKVSLSHFFFLFLARSQLWVPEKSVRTMLGAANPSSTCFSVLMCTSGIFELKAVSLVKLMKEESSYALNFNFWYAYNIAYSKMFPSFTVWSVKKLPVNVCSLCIRRDSVLLLLLLEGTLDLITLCIQACVFILKSAGIFSYHLTDVVCNSKIMCPHVVETGLGSTVE